MRSTSKRFIAAGKENSLRVKHVLGGVSRFPCDWDVLGSFRRGTGYRRAQLNTICAERMFD